MTRRTVIACAIAAVFAVGVLAGCVNAKPSYPPNAGPPTTGDWAVANPSGPSQDATTAYMQSKTKVIQPGAEGPANGIVGPESDEATNK